MRELTLTEVNVVQGAAGTPVIPEPTPSPVIQGLEAAGYTAAVVGIVYTLLALRVRKEYAAKTIGGVGLAATGVPSVLVGAIVGGTAAYNQK